MDILVVGDGHGTYNTFKKLVEESWNYSKEILIQTGDLIDRGMFSPQLVSYCKELKSRYPSNTFFLKGNHEEEAIAHFTIGANLNWFNQCGRNTLKQYRTSKVDFKKDIEWFRSMPMYWENEHLFISHAGVPESINHSEDYRQLKQILWNRDTIKNIKKLQVFGHTPLRDGKPLYNKERNYWNIDTGAGYGDYLTALRLTCQGELIEVIQVAVLPEDVGSILQA